MKKQLLIIGITLLFLAVGLSGCNQANNPLNSDKDKFVGTWNVNAYGQTGTYVFYSNGTLVVSDAPRSLTWEIKDGKLVITDQLPVTSSYYFTNDDKRVVLINTDAETTATLTKQ